jgi:hypothetical protein
MTEPEEERLDAALRAYQEIEPRRRQSPFSHPQLALIAAERSSRLRSPWYRRLIAQPAPAFAASALALFLLVLPVSPTEITDRAVVAEMEASAAPVIDSAAPTTATDEKSMTEQVEPIAPVEAGDLGLLAVAVAAAVIGVRRLRSSRG